MGSVIYTGGIRPGVIAHTSTGEVYCPYNQAVTVPNADLPGLLAGPFTAGDGASQAYVPPTPHTYKLPLVRDDGVFVDTALSPLSVGSGTGTGSDVLVNGSHVATLNVTTPVLPSDIGAATAAALTSEVSRAQAAEVLLKPPAYYLNGGVNLRESVPRPAGVVDAATALTSGVMTLVAIVLYAGDVIANLTFRSQTTAAGTPTNWWFALYDPSFNLLSQTADQGAAAWTANTSRTRALAAAQTIATSGVYYAAVMVKATTVPSLTCLSTTSGMNGAGAVITSQKLVAGTFGTALTTTAPASAATPASIGPIPYAVAS